MFFRRRKERKLAEAMRTSTLNGDVERVKALLKENPGLANTQDEYGITPLHRAGNANVAELLISKGADVNARNSSGATPLYSAALEGRADVVELLISKGADVNAHSTDGYTPLFWAAMKGHVEVMRILLAQGAAVDAPDQFGQTPLSIAVSQGDAEVVRVLLVHGANINARISKVLDWTPLHRAASEGHVEVARVLLAHGANINARTSIGATPLHSAALEGRADVVELLISKGADVNARTRDGSTASQFAAHKGHARVVELLGKHSYEWLWEQIRFYKPIFLFLRTDRLRTEGLLSNAMAPVFVRLAKDYRARVESITVNADECRDLTDRLGYVVSERISFPLAIPCFALVRSGITVGEWRLRDVAGAYNWSITYEKHEKRPETEILARLTFEESVRQRLDALRPTLWFLINC